MLEKPQAFLSMASLPGTRHCVSAASAAQQLPSAVLLFVVILLEVGSAAWCAVLSSTCRLSVTAWSGFGWQAAASVTLVTQSVCCSRLTQDQVATCTQCSALLCPRLALHEVRGNPHERMCKGMTA